MRYNKMSWRLYPLFGALLLLASVVMAGCGSGENGSSPTDPTVTFGTPNELTTLDPINSQEPYTLQVIGQLTEGLVTLNGENKLVGDLARDWDHDSDYTTWRFQIREGVRFHEHPVFDSLGSGRTLDAEDVRYSFERAVSSESYPAFVLAGVVEGVGAYQNGDSDHVSGFTVVDSLTFQIELSRPDPSFLHRITSPWFGIYPDEVQKLEGQTFGQDAFIGTGPFELVSRSDTRVRLRRFEDYWGATKGNVEELEFRVVKNDQLRLQELRNGNIDLMRAPTSLLSTVTKEGTLELQQSADLEGERYNTFNSSFIGFNSNEMDRPLRRAISHAVDREELANTITFGSGRPTIGTVPDGMEYDPLSAEGWHDPEQARRLVEKSSYAGQPIELLVHGQKNVGQLGELVAQQLSEVGIEIELNNLSYNTVVQRMIDGNTEAFALSLEYVYSAPAPILFDVFHSGKTPAPNFWRYESAKVDSMLVRLRGVAEQSKSNKIAHEIERTVAQDAPAAFLYQLRKLALHRPTVSGISFNGHSIPLLWNVKVQTET
jgi:peptide/nickel transport system substrate-binding protein